jgi:hypothetical protein
VPLAGDQITGPPGVRCMATIVLVAAAGMFVLGVVAGTVAVASYGIHRERKRLRDEQDTWAGPDAPEYFLAERAPDLVSGAARRLNGLYVCHLPSQSPMTTAWQGPPSVTDASDR